MYLNLKKLSSSYGKSSSHQNMSWRFVLGSLCVVLSVALFFYQAGCDITALALKKEQAEQLLA